jgi:hypothetical protein
MKVSTAEVTLLDLVARPRRGGGLSNVATVAGEMPEEGRLDAQAFADAARAYPVSVIQRTGGSVDDRWNVQLNAGVERDLRSRTRTSSSGLAGSAGQRPSSWNRISSYPVSFSRQRAIRTSAKSSSSAAAPVSTSSTCLL